VFILPDQNITLTMLEDRSSMKFDLCVFDYQKVAHLAPSSLEFRRTAVQNAVSLMDDRIADIGSKITFSPASLGLAGKTVGFLIVPNNTRSTFLTNPWRYTPKGEGDRTKRQPLFTLNGANPGLHDQFLTFNTAKSTVFAIEDHTRHHDAYLPELGERSDSSFDDIIVQFDRLLQPAGNFQSAYRIASPDPTKGYIGDDGHPKQLMSYLGLTPGEYSSGGKSKRTGITKCGNSHARWMLVECATHYGKEPRVGAHLSARQEGLPRWVREKSWTAQNRLYLRFTNLRKRLMHHNKIKVAVARELCGVIWETGYKIQSSATK
jgi:hypothetical protein